MFDVWFEKFPVSSPELLILPAVDQNVDGGVEDEEKVGEECEDLTPHWPVVQWSRAVDKKKTELQHKSPKSPLLTQKVNVGGGWCSGQRPNLLVSLCETEN